jgi:hypothetical protein
MGSSTIKVNAFSFHDLSDSANPDDDDDDEEQVVGKAEPEARSKRPRAPLVHPRARARSELARPKASDVGVSDTSTACRRSTRRFAAAGGDRRGLFRSPGSRRSASSMRPGRSPSPALMAGGVALMVLWMRLELDEGYDG